MTNPWTPVAPTPESWSGADDFYLCTEDNYNISTEDGYLLLGDFFPVSAWSVVSGSAPPWFVVG